jgi:hypothetical protein
VCGEGRMKQKIVSVVTCDVARSQRYSTDQRRRMDGILKKAFETVTRVYPEAIHTPTSFSVIQGDEFQFVLSTIEKAYEITVFYRALVALSDLTPMLTFRSAVGIGEIAVENKKNSYTQDGPAFHRSRQGIDHLQTPRMKGRRRSKIITGDPEFNETLDIVLMYQDLLEEQWTRAQWEAIRWRFQLATYEDIASKIGIAYQNVQKRLKAARWDKFSRGLDFIDGGLRRHLSQDANPRFTLKKV